MSYVTKNLEDSVKKFFNSIVIPVFEEIKTKLERVGKSVNIEQTQKDCVTIKVSSDDEEYSYSILTIVYQPGEFISKQHVVPKAKIKIKNYHPIPDISLRKKYYTLHDISITSIKKHFKICSPYHLSKYL